MGTIRERKRKDGSKSYQVQIILKNNGKVIHSESETFHDKRRALMWMMGREDELQKNRQNLVNKDEVYDPPLSDLINRYQIESKRDHGRTKTQVLNSITRTDFAKLRASEIDQAAIYGFMQTLGKDKLPQTVLNYMSHLSGIFAIANPVWNAPLDKKAFDNAMTAGRRMGFIGKSNKRDRRPTLDELDDILYFFTERSEKYPESVDMVRVIIFALFSTRRQEEITRITWPDLEEEHSRIMVRDMKHPGQKIGNDQWCDLPPEALRVIQSMPKTAGPIFPYNSKSISNFFTRCCKVLSIEDLHFHDLRHEGISRLAEMGWSIPHIAAVSGHRSWSSLNRYSHVRKKGDKYEGWEWMAAIN